MNPLTWMSEQIIQASDLFQRGRPSEAVNLLVQATQSMPRRRGAADALALVAKAYLQIERAHQGEVACLVSARLTPTLIDPDLLFDNLVNLTAFTLRLKSFEEAYAYGLLAEQIRGGDSDLEANLVGACALTGRLDEAMTRFERLKVSSPVKAGMLGSYFAADGPAIPETTPTRHLDCSHLLVRIRDAVSSDHLEEFHAAIADLQERPDGQGARDCWLEVYRFYCESLAASDWDEYQAFQGYAGVVAATGKVISADPAAAENDAPLWTRRGAALTELRLYELAVPALEHAAALAPGEPNVQNALQQCREVLRLRESAATDPRILLDAARQAARTHGRFWYAYDLFGEAFVRSNRSTEERLQQSESLHKRGFDLFQTDSNEATALMCEAAANVPESSHTWQELATLHFLKREFGPAELFQRYAVELVASTSPLPADAGRFYFNLANIRLNRAESEFDISSDVGRMKLAQAATDARRAIELGDQRGNVVLQQLGVPRVASSRALAQPGRGCLLVLPLAIALVIVGLAVIA